MGKLGRLFNNEEEISFKKQKLKERVNVEKDTRKKEDLQRS